MNRYKYFVTNSTLGEWTKLPDIAPSQLRAARLIRVLFTGDLERKIFTNPFFEGKEKHYLRAQIARISHSTSLIPKGLMRPIEDDENRGIEENTPDEGEIVMPSTTQMKSLDMWVHATKNILKNGTTILKQPEAPEGEEWDDDRVNAEMKKLLESDPYAPLLSPVSDDAKISVSKTMKQSAWICRLTGDTTEYISELTRQKVSNGIVVVKSLQWPGSINFYFNGRFQKIYVGDGHKYEQGSTFYPVDPPMMNVD